MQPGLSGAPRCKHDDLLDRPELRRAVSASSSTPTTCVTQHPGSCRPPTALTGSPVPHVHAGGRLRTDACDGQVDDLRATKKPRDLRGFRRAAEGTRTL